MKKIISQISKYKELPINYSFYPSDLTDAPIIIYFHGGGLLFGQRDDLPDDYISLLVSSGYHFLAIDYLLAPESQLTTILEVLTESLFHLLKQFQVKTYHFMGRSAGSYLAYYLIRQGFEPQSFLSFYGYYQLTLPEFSLPAPFYLSYPFVSSTAVESFIGTAPLTHGNMNKRFPIYLSSRQSGNWLNYLTTHDKREYFSLTDTDLMTFPPTLLLHSLNDPDVPYRLSKKASELIPNSQLISINGNQHDFDRAVTSETLAVYQQIVAFLNAT